MTKSQKNCVVVCSLVLVLFLQGAAALAATSAPIQTAIDAGIDWLISQQDPNGSWQDPSTWNRGGTTGLALIKLQDRAYELGFTSPFDPCYPLKQNVEDGLDYIFSEVNIIPISAQPAGDPDSDGDGNGVYLGSDNWHRTYETGIAMMAIAASRTPNRVVNVPGSLVDGWTYKDVLQDMVDYLAFGQCDGGSSRGGWDYTDNTGFADNSNSGYAVLGLAYTEALAYGFNCTIPPFVKSELNLWIDYIQNDVDGDSQDGGSGYSDPCDWPNMLKTGNLIFQMTFYGDSVATQRLQDAVDYLERHYNDANTDPGWGNPDFYVGTPHYQAMYCIMKGLEYAGIDTLNVAGSPNDWYEDFADAIVNTQLPDGNFPPDDWGGTTLATTWALLTLEKSAPPPPTPKTTAANAKWSQPPIEIDPCSATPTYCGWDEPSYRGNIWFEEWDCPYQCHGDADCNTEKFAMVWVRVGDNDLDMFIPAYRTSFGDPCYNPACDFTRDYYVDDDDLAEFIEYYRQFDPCFAPQPDCPGPVLPVELDLNDTPAEFGKFNYWDLFTVTISTDANYWELVNGGYGDIDDPIPTRDPTGYSLIDPNTALNGVIWAYGGHTAGQMDDHTEDTNIMIINDTESDFYLSVMLDTATNPQADRLNSSWGAISNIVVYALGPDGNTLPGAVTPQWSVSPLDPDGGTNVSTAGPVTDITLAANDFGDGKSTGDIGDYQDPATTQDIGIWGAAAKLPSAYGYRVQFSVDINTWDIYDGGPQGPDQTLALPTTKFRQAADDFRCIGPMPLTSIHWWGSYVGWEGPEPPAAPNKPSTWRLSIWSNVPAGVDADYSHPGTLLWQLDLREDRVDEEFAGYDFFPDPCITPDTCFQYFTELEPEEYFWQDEYTNLTYENIFWLSIAAIFPEDTNAPYAWGWKTRPAHWADDAVVFETFGELSTGASVDMNNISPIEYEGESFDLAFELDTDANFVKAEQRFTGLRGWPHYEDEESIAHHYPPVEPNDILLVADDWLCDTNKPVTAAVWWGSYLGYSYLPCQPPVPDDRIRPDYFLLTMWTDVPDDDPCNEYGYSHPNDIIWEYHAYDYDEVMVGFDKHPHGSPNEPVFRYSVRIPDTNWFCQENNEAVYWFSVVAVYDVNTPTYAWGWTNHEYVFNDNAVQGQFDVYSSQWSWVELRDQTEQSEDMSFMLFNGCMPCCHEDYLEWLAVGQPHCWCCPTQCHGDADCAQEKIGPKWYWVAYNDLAVLTGNWKTNPPGEPGICADFSHSPEKIGPKWYRIAYNDLGILVSNWKSNPDPNCLDCP